MDVRFNGRAVQGHRSTSGSFTAGKPGKPRRQRMNRDGAAREGARQGRAIVQRTYMVCPSKPLLGWADGERGRSCRKCSLPRPCRPTSSHIVPVVPGTTDKFLGGPDGEKEETRSSLPGGPTTVGFKFLRRVHVHVHVHVCAGEYLQPCLMVEGGPVGCCG